ncbi:FAD-dependent monooxygenase, partial [Nocardiopsis rhodophaea]|uniref:FAD-dependent monooxygenase n=1 Tax=Nocardiopsis rhodophaea TaxID=280238 RepID=UPI0039EE771F
RVAAPATAILLADLGHRVLLVDRHASLGPTLSTHVFGDWEAFEPLGVADGLAASGAPPMRRFRTDTAGCVTEADMVITPYVLALRRERLDPLLLDRARSLGATWLGGHSLVGLRTTRDRVTGAVLRAPGGERTVAARVVVGADGRGSRVALQAGAAAYLTRPAVRCAFYAYYRGMGPARPSAFEYYWADDDLVLVAACDDGLHCVCVMPPESEFGRWRRDRERLLADRLATLPTLAPRLAEAERVGPVRGTRRLESHLKQAYGPGWALVGDAGAVVHPCIGAGIDHAAASAGMLATALHRHLTGARDWETAMADYQRQRDARIRPALEAAVRLAQRRAPDAAETRELRLLLTQPGLSADLGRHVPDVVRAIGGDRALDGFRAFLADPDLPEPTPSGRTP